VVLMPVSQNARFTATFPSDPEFVHPPGAWLARCLQAELHVQGWTTEEFDNWRDCGWVVRSVHNRAVLEVCFAAGDEGWFLQVAPTSGASPRDCHALARAVDQCLLATGMCSALRWSWDGDPAEVPSSASPPSPF
jgi:hypothetical protein